MYNAQMVKERINNAIKNQKISASKLLLDCELNPNTINKITDKNGLSSFSLAKIADYLNVSVDYLLGRTDNPNGCSGDNITIGDTNGNYNMTVGKGETKPLQIDGLSKEMLEKFERLDFDKKVEVMALISSLSKK